MKVFRNITAPLVVTGLLLLVLLAAGPVALAQENEQPAERIVSETYTLTAGSTVNNDLIVVAQTIILEPDTIIQGDVVLVSEEVVLQGTINGHLTVMGSDISLTSGSRFQGDAHLCAANTISRDSNVIVTGEYSAGCEGLGAVLGTVVPLAFAPEDWEWDEFEATEWDWGRFSNRIETRRQEADLSLGEKIAFNLGFSLFMGAVAGLSTLVVPMRLRRISDAALSAQLSTFGVGLLTLVVMTGITGVVVLSLVLMVTICLVPFVALGWLAIALSMAVGWSAVSLPIGAWLLARFRVQHVTPLAAASVGAVVTTFGLGLLSLSAWTIPLYLIVGTGMGSIGLGAVVLTKAGDRIYPNPTRVWTSPNAAATKGRVEV